ncbi:MAG: hypothetical protein AAGA30_05845, partial [Planctomycetota bacterium]
IRFYDLSDVFSVAPQYPAQVSNDFNESSSLIFPIAGHSNGGQFLSGGGFGGGGGGVFNIPPGRAQQQPQPTSVQAARVSVSSLVDAVKQTVAPDEWDDRNGDASISILGNTLLISATEPMHEQIADLMDLFREQWGKLKTVSVQAFWIRADAVELAALLENDELNAVVGKIGRRPWGQFLNQAKEENRLVYAANLCGQNGQTLHTVSGLQHHVITDGEPIYSYHGTQEEIEDEMINEMEQSVAGLRPIRNLFQEGAAIQISPLATRGGNYLILDLHTRINEYKDAGEGTPSQIVASGRDGNEFSVPLNSRPYHSYRLSTTIRCPNNEVVLAGGMNSDSANSNLYVFVRSKVHTIEEDTIGGQSK